jgi:hypothetical protein
MGDRGNIVVKCEGEQVCLYTHWQGSNIRESLKNALINSDRWNDFQYLTAIIFREMLGNEKNGTTGFGITQKIHDGGDKVFYVDVDTKTVTYKNDTVGFYEFIS